MLYWFCLEIRGFSPRVKPEISNQISIIRSLLMDSLKKLIYWRDKGHVVKSSDIIKKHKIKNQELFNQALTHRSYDKGQGNNERLEFLGDAVLSLLIADLLIEKYPLAPEGELTKKRSQLVSGQTLAQIAIELDFPQLLKTSKEEYKKNHRILAGALEAYIGAFYLERDLLSTKKLIISLFQKRLNQKIPELNYKAILQEWCQKKYKKPPSYKLSREEGLAHKKIFFIDVFVQDQHCGTGSSGQKKQAEQKAAQQAIDLLKISAPSA